MDSLYAKYIKERTNDKIIEIPEGFATYRYLDYDKTVYIVDIFVLPVHREKGVASALADKIFAEAKKKGCNSAVGTVQPSTKTSTQSLKVLLAYGFRIQSSGNDFIVLEKDLT